MEVSAANNQIQVQIVALILFFRIYYLVTLLYMRQLSFLKQFGYDPD